MVADSLKLAIDQLLIINTNPFREANTLFFNNYIKLIFQSKTISGFTV